MYLTMGGRGGGSVTIIWVIVVTLWSLLCFILFINLASKTVMIIMKLIVIIVIYCLQRFLFYKLGKTLITCFVKVMVTQFTVVRLNYVNVIISLSFF